MLEHFLVVSGLACAAFHSFKEESEVFLVEFGVITLSKNNFAMRV